MKRTKRGMLACVALSGLTLLAGCSLPAFLRFEGTRLGWDEIALSASSDANLNSPVAVDVVLALDAPMVERLAELPATRWFATREDLRKTYPKAVVYRSWELVPGQRLRIDADTFGSPRVHGAFVFADYATPGAHRIRVDNLKDDFLVRLDRSGFSIAPRP